MLVAEVHVSVNFVRYKTSRGNKFLEPSVSQAKALYFVVVFIYGKPVV
jgi:hypothetical protein